MTPPRLRFAPSPSGFLHIGGARTALFCWLLARRHGGTFVLRVEDTDAARTTDASIESILEGMRWLGLDWDEGPGVGGPHAPYFQSQRGPIYEEHIQQLQDKGLLYRCYATKEELAASREAAMAEGRPPLYDRAWRDKGPADWPEGQPYVWRLKIPLDGEVVVDDVVRGRIAFKNKEFSDPVLVRSNGDPLYNFVVVVDDALMGMTHVVRGDDHISNTPKQVHIYDALGLTPPAFAHLPLILGPDKKRLSKRHGATNVMQYADEGYLSGALVNYLVRLGWSHGDQEIFTRQEMIDAFGLEAVGRSPGVWNPEKLLWLNATWITRTDSAELARAIAPAIKAAGHPDCEPDDVMVARVDTLKERARTLVELRETGDFYWSAGDSVTLDASVAEDMTGKARKSYLKALNNLLSADSAALLGKLIPGLEAAQSWDEATLEAVFNAVQEETGLSMGRLAQPVRLAITGGTASPGIFETLVALGREKSLVRLKSALALAAAAAQAQPEDA